MSACISSHGEFSSHEFENAVCRLCGFEDVQGLLQRLRRFAATFEAVPHRDENVTQSTEEAYDEGYAVGHNDALTELGRLLGKEDS